MSLTSRQLNNRALRDLSKITVKPNASNDVLDVVEETTIDMKVDTISNNKCTDDYIKGIWIVTAYGIDFPKSKNPTEQKEELDSLVNYVAAKDSDAS